MKLALPLFCAAALCASLVAVSCGTPACDEASCDGCCDAAGQCQTGLEVDACGIGGVTCGACWEGLVCQVGYCVANVLTLGATTSPDPPRVGTNSLSINITDLEGAPVVGASVQVSFMMPSMPGMGTDYGTVVDQGGGIYLVPDLNFSMGGGWRVTITATASGNTQTLALTYTL